MTNRTELLCDIVSAGEDIIENAAAIGRADVALEAGESFALLAALVFGVDHGAGFAEIVVAIAEHGDTPALRQTLALLAAAAIARSFAIKFRLDGRIQLAPGCEIRSQRAITEAYATARLSR